MLEIDPILAASDYNDPVRNKIMSSATSSTDLLLFNSQREPDSSNTNQPSKSTASSSVRLNQRSQLAQDQLSKIKFSHNYLLDS